MVVESVISTPYSNALRLGLIIVDVLCMSLSGRYFLQMFVLTSSTALAATIFTLMLPDCYHSKER